jgi:hypothetical protein
MNQGVENCRKSRLCERITCKFDIPAGDVEYESGIQGKINIWELSVN